MFGMRGGDVDDRGKGDQEERSLGGLSDDWFVRSQANQGYIDTRGENNIQFSRVVPGAVWPPVAMWRSLDYISENQPLVFDPFAEEDDRRPPSLAFDDETDRSRSTPGTPDSDLSSHPCPRSISQEIIAAPSTGGIDTTKERVDVEEGSSSRLKILAPKALSREKWREELPEAVAVNDVDKFLSRGIPVKSYWERDTKVTSEEKLKHLVLSRYLHTRGTRKELLRSLEYGR